MAGLKELRNRLESVKSTEKITSAMKLVAASRLRKADLALDRSAYYSQMIKTTIKRIMADLALEEKEKKIKFILPELLRPRQHAQNYLLFVFSSDRGLCGSYNQNVGKAALARIKELETAGKSVKIICYGKKSYAILKKKHSDKILEVNEAVAGKGISFDAAVKLGEKISAYCNNGTCDVCEIIYAKYHSAISREILAMQIYPLQESSLETSAEDKNLVRVGDAYYDYYPDRFAMLDALLPKLIVNLIFAAMANSQASEQGARMAAMDNATRNAKDMISELTLKYNGIRQSAITTELTEIISGAEAL
jgi:F-type H+-transporting ATPase subunit gamma